MNIVLTSLAALALTSAPMFGHHESIQGGPSPIKISGPTLISINRRSSQVTNLRTIYYYTVTLNATSSNPTTVYIDDTGNKIYHPSYIVIPANTLSGNFGAQPAVTGNTTLRAYNANGEADLNVTIDF